MKWAKVELELIPEEVGFLIKGNVQGNTEAMEVLAGRLLFDIAQASNKPLSVEMIKVWGNARRFEDKTYKEKDGFGNSKHTVIDMRAIEKILKEMGEENNDKA